MNNEISSSKNGEIVLYQPSDNIQLEVTIDVNHDTVWLTTAQMSQLFCKEDSTIRRHVINVFKDGELDKENNVRFLHVNGVKKPVPFYNLDVILSVGYRVHSPQGIFFRRWATSVLKEYLLRGYSINHQLVAMQERIDSRFTKLEDRMTQNEEKIQFFVKTNVPPAEQVFFEGDFYTARVAFESLVKTAKFRAIIIDAYVSAITLDILEARANGVDALIYTAGVGHGMQNLMTEHDRLFPSRHIDIRKWRNECHDRFLIIDDTLYHCGHSLNATGGHKISAIIRMGTTPDVILSRVQ